MAYASLSDVIALNSARQYTATSRPATSMVGGWLDQRAAELDAVLVEKGYSIPVPTTASSALLLLQNMNAVGAWALAEGAAEASPFRDMANNMWENAISMLRSQTVVLDMPKSQPIASPRGPGLTQAPGVTDQPYDPNFGSFTLNGVPVDTGGPLFTRSQQF